MTKADYAELTKLLKKIHRQMEVDGLPKAWRRNIEDAIVTVGRVHLEVAKAKQ